jgi:translation initiation factor IF-3
MLHNILKGNYFFIRLFSSAKAIELKNEFLIKRHPLVRIIDRVTGKLSEPTRSGTVFSERPTNFDLVLVDSRQEPPIVKFQSQSEAFKQIQLREEAATRARLANKFKEMHLTTVTGEHDFQVKIGKVDEWIRKGWRVKMVIEEKKQTKKSIAQPADSKRILMNTIVGKLAGIAEIVGTPELERGCLIFTLHGSQKIMSQLKQERFQQQQQNNSNQ